MIKEDYVSLETAMLLKEKGFDWEVHRSYIVNHNVFIPRYMNDIPLVKDAIRIPTLQMAMKWLRDTHNLCIEPYRTACGYLCSVTRIPTGSTIYEQDHEGDDESTGQFTTHEKACEAAIKYCLENLI